MKLFENWVDGGGDVKSSLELAGSTGADPDLVGEFIFILPEPRVDSGYWPMLKIYFEGGYWSIWQRWEVFVGSAPTNTHPHRFPGH